MSREDCLTRKSPFTFYSIFIPSTPLLNGFFIELIGAIQYPERDKLGGKQGLAMPIHYDINPDLNIILYVCSGLITGSDLFSVAEEAMNDKRRKPGMLVIIDSQSADAVIELADLHHTIEWTEKARSDQLDAAQIIILTKSVGLNLLADTLRLMSKGVEFRLDVLHTRDEVIDILGMSDRKEKVLNFWENTRSNLPLTKFSSQTLSTKTIELSADPQF